MIFVTITMNTFLKVAVNQDKTQVKVFWSWSSMKMFVYILLLSIGSNHAKCSRSLTKMGG